MIRFDFTDKVALVTGSSRGIGAAILRGFVTAGATGVLHYFADPDGANKADADKLLAELPAGKVVALPADVRDAGQMETLMADVKARFGGLDILVNNAGILRDRSLRKMTPDDWQAVLSTNLTGVFHGCKFGADILRDGGRIVNIASVDAVAPEPRFSHYDASKGGLVALTRSLALELGPHRITINGVGPGLIDGPGLEANVPKRKAAFLAHVPLGTIGQPQEIADAVLFFASDMASWVTGQTLYVDGGVMLAGYMWGVDE